MPYIFAGKSAVGEMPISGKMAAGLTAATAKGKAGMGRLIKLVVFLVVLGFVGLVGYAYLADMTPARQEVKQPVVLNVQ